MKCKKFQLSIEPSEMDFHLMITELWLISVRLTAFSVEARHEALLGLVALRQSKTEPCEMNKYLRGTALSIVL
jgi:hypothetical protein